MQHADYMENACQSPVSCWVPWAAIMKRAANDDSRWPSVVEQEPQMKSHYHCFASYLLATEEEEAAVRSLMLVLAPAVLGRTIKVVKAVGWYCFDKEGEFGEPTTGQKFAFVLHLPKAYTLTHGQHAVEGLMKGVLGDDVATLVGKRVMVFTKARAIFAQWGWQCIDAMLLEPEEALRETQPDVKDYDSESDREAGRSYVCRDRKCFYSRGKRYKLSEVAKDLPVERLCELADEAETALALQTAAAASALDLDSPLGALREAERPPDTLMVLGEAGEAGEAGKPVSNDILNTEHFVIPNRDIVLTCYKPVRQDPQVVQSYLERAREWPAQLGPQDVPALRDCINRAVEEGVMREPTARTKLNWMEAFVQGHNGQPADEATRRAIRDANKDVPPTRCEHCGKATRDPFVARCTDESSRDFCTVECASEWAATFVCDTCGNSQRCRPAELGPMQPQDFAKLWVCARCGAEMFHRDGPLRRRLNLRWDMSQAAYGF